MNSVIYSVLLYFTSRETFWSFLSRLLYFVFIVYSEETVEVNTWNPWERYSKNHYYLLRLFLFFILLWLIRLPYVNPCIVDWTSKHLRSTLFISLMNTHKIIMGLPYYFSEWYTNYRYVETKKLDDEIRRKNKCKITICEFNYRIDVYLNVCYTLVSVCRE